MNHSLYKVIHWKDPTQKNDSFTNWTLLVLLGILMRKSNNNGIDPLFLSKSYHKASEDLEYKVTESYWTLL